MIQTIQLKNTEITYRDEKHRKRLHDSGASIVIVDIAVLAALSTLRKRNTGAYMEM